MTVTGTNLDGITPGSIKFGSSFVTVMSSSPTEIVLISPAKAPGKHTLNYDIVSLGNIQSSLELDYRLYVSMVTPRIGSIRGGTKVQVYGEGFSTDCANNGVAFGQQTCEVIDCASDWIVCQTSDAFVTEEIDNSATSARKIISFIL